MDVRFKRFSVKNPTERPSGDQNGPVAPSVPGSGRDTSESNEWSQSLLPSLSRPANTRWCPSGETANGDIPKVDSKLTFSGGAIVNRTTRSCR